MGKTCSKFKKAEPNVKYTGRTSVRLTSNKEMKETEKITFKVSLENLKAKNLSHVRIFLIDIFYK